MPSKPANLLRLSLLITCAISSKVMSQFNVLQASLTKGCDKFKTTWSVELPCAPAGLLGHCPSSSFWKPVTKSVLLIAMDRSLVLEYCFQKLAGFVFASAHNCCPCSFLYVRFLRRNSCLSCFLHSRARWLLGWSFAYANTSLCLLQHSVSNHGWWWWELWVASCNVYRACIARIALELCIQQKGYQPDSHVALGSNKAVHWVHCFLDSTLMDLRNI